MFLDQPLTETQKHRTRSKSVNNLGQLHLVNGGGSLMQIRACVAFKSPMDLVMSCAKHYPLGWCFSQFDQNLQELEIRFRRILHSKETFSKRI